jgi:hypothetical protein
MKIETPQPTRADAALLRNTVIKLTAATRAWTIAVVAVVAFIWWRLLHKVIAFGKGLDYSGLEALGVQIATFVKQYNPFFWWGIVALCTLIIAYFLYGFVEAMNRRASSRRIDADIIARLASRLSPPAVQVMQWSWHNRREPITVGVLQRALRELQSGRAARIELASRHAALLDAAAGSRETDRPLPSA